MLTKEIAACSKFIVKSDMICLKSCEFSKFLFLFAKIHKHKLWWSWKTASIDAFWISDTEPNCLPFNIIFKFRNRKCSIASSLHSILAIEMTYFHQQSLIVSSLYPLTTVWLNKKNLVMNNSTETNAMNHWRQQLFSL